MDFPTSHRTTAPSKRKRSLLRDQRGTASIEAAVMLPVMAICWAGLMLRFDQIERFLHGATVARRDAWIFSNSGCEGDNPGRAEIAPECAGDDQSSGLSWAAGLQKIPVVGYLVDSIFGYRFTATGVEPYTEPPLFGGKSKSSRYSYHLTCNEASRDGKQILSQVLVQTVDSLGLGFGISDDAKPINRRAACK
jgi:hypothetical protein